MLVNNYKIIPATSIRTTTPISYTDEPLAVPVEIDCRDAQRLLFSKGDAHNNLYRIYIRPALRNWDSYPRPEQQFHPDLLTYSFTREDWFRNILPEADAKRLKQNKGTMADVLAHANAWDERIIPYAARQRQIPQNTVKANEPSRSLRFFHFVQVEVALVDAKSPNNYQYALYAHDGGKQRYWYVAFVQSIRDKKLKANMVARLKSGQN